MPKPNKLKPFPNQVALTIDLNITDGNVNKIIISPCGLFLACLQEYKFIKIYSTINGCMLLCDNYENIVNDIIWFSVKNVVILFIAIKNKILLINVSDISTIYYKKYTKNIIESWNNYVSDNKLTNSSLPIWK